MRYSRLGMVLCFMWLAVGSLAAGEPEISMRFFDTSGQLIETGSTLRPGALTHTAPAGATPGTFNIPQFQVYQNIAGRRVDAAGVTLQFALINSGDGNLNLNNYTWDDPATPALFDRYNVYGWFEFSPWELPLTVTPGNNTVLRLWIYPEFPGRYTLPVRFSNHGDNSDTTNPVRSENPFWFKVENTAQPSTNAEAHIYIMNDAGTVRARPIIDADQAGQYFYGVTEHDLGVNVPRSPSVTPVRYRIYNTGLQVLRITSITFPPFATSPGGGPGLPLSNVVGSVISPAIVNAATPLVVPAYNPSVTYATDIEDMTQNPAPYVDIIIGVKPTVNGDFLLPVKVGCNDTDEAGYDWLISGSAVDAPEIEVLQNGVTNIVDTPNGALPGTETAVAGGTLVNGIPEKAKAYQFTIKNTGNIALTVNKPVLTSTAAIAAMGTDPWGAAATITIAAGATAEMSIVIYPNVPVPPGPWTVTVSCANNDADEDPFNFVINGTASVPVAEIEITRGESIPDGGLDILDIPVGVAQNLTYVIRNTGDANLSIFGASLAGARNATVGAIALAPQVVARGTSINLPVTITRTGTTADVYAVDIRVDNSDPNESTYVFQATNYASGDTGDGKKCGFGAPFGLIALLSLLLIRRRAA